MKWYKALAAVPLMFSMACGSGRCYKEEVKKHERLIPLNYVQRGLLGDIYVKDGYYAFEDIAKNGTPDIYFDPELDRSIFILRNGMLETPFSGEKGRTEFVGKLTVDAESPKGKEILEKCYAIKIAVENEEAERKKKEAK